MSTFSGISGALSSLYAQRRGMEITGQNIANANTPGYSRQRVDLQSVGGSVMPAMHAVGDGSAGGVTIAKLDRLRDQFLEGRARAEHAQGASLNGRAQVLRQIEEVFAEPSDTAMQSQLADFWASWGDVGNQPGDAAARTQMLQRGAVVVDGLKAAHNGLSTQWNTIRVQADGHLRDINGNAAAVAQLNEAIVRGSAADMPVNEFMDQRDVHLIKLAELTGATTVTRPDGSADVFLEGSALVNGSAVRTVELAGAGRMADHGIDKVRLRWSDNQTAVAPGGTMGATVEALGDTVPGYAAKLDAIAARLAATVNPVHQSGYGRDGVNNRQFFTTTPPGVPVTATTITVGITDAAHVAASGTPGGGLDSSNADALARLGRLTDGGDAMYREMVVGLGVATQAAGRRSDIQATVTDAVDASRMGESGVNLDEEMTNMLSFQRAYEAAARMLTTLDGMLDTLINRTGLVGR